MLISVDINMDIICTLLIRTYIVGFLIGVFEELMCKR